MDSKYDVKVVFRGYDNPTGTAEVLHHDKPRFTKGKEYVATAVTDYKRPPYGADCLVDDDNGLAQLVDMVYFDEVVDG